MSNNEALKAVAAAVKLLSSRRGVKMTAATINGRTGLEGLTNQAVSRIIRDQLPAVAALAGLQLIYVAPEYEVKAQGRRRDVRSDRTAFRPGFAAAFVQVV